MDYEWKKGVMRCSKAFQKACHFYVPFLFGVSKGKESLSLLELSSREQLPNSYLHLGLFRELRNKNFIPFESYMFGLYVFKSILVYFNNVHYTF